MPFVVSEGSIRSLAKPTRATPRSSLQLADGLTQDYGEIWRTQPAVRTVVSFLARNLASLRIHAFERVSDTDRRRLDPGEALPSLLSKPNPRTTRYALINALVHDIGIFDMAGWLLLKGPALVRVPPKMIKPVGDNWLWPDRFEIKGSKGVTEVSADDMIYLHGFNPDDASLGCSPIESLRRILAEDFEAGRMREQVLRNGARASGYLTRPKEAGKWSNRARERFRSQWQSQYTGSGAGAGGTPILEDGMEFIAASQTAEQLQYIQARKLTREEAAAAYHLPAPMVGILDEANFASMSEFHKMLYQDALGPWLVWFEEELGMQLVPHLATGHVYVEFNLQEKLRGSFEEQAAAASAATGAPWMTRNEQRSKFNLPALAGGDELVTPLNVLIGGQASPRDSDATSGQLAAPAPFSNVAPFIAKHREVMEASLDRQERSAKSAAGAGEDVTARFDRWLKELGTDLFKLAVVTSEFVTNEALHSLGVDPKSYDADPLTLDLVPVSAEFAAELLQAVKLRVDPREPQQITAAFTEVKTDAVPAVAERAVQAVIEASVRAVGQQFGATHRSTDRRRAAACTRPVP